MTKLSESRILIIDDQKANTDLLVQFLEYNGYSDFKAINDSRLVKTEIINYKPDLLLLDIMMPHISGVEILDWLNEEEFMSTPLRVMVLTADATKETLKQVLSLGAHDMLRKPFDLVELELRLKNLLESNSMQKQLNDRSVQLEILVEKRTKELAQKNDELEQFIYVASHDTQEPLRMITGFLNLLEKKYSSSLDDKAKEYIHYSVDGAERMRNMISGMLDFSRAGRITTDNLEWVDLNEILDDVLISLHRLTESSQAIINRHSMPKVAGIYVPIRQVIQNILTNALTFHVSGQKPVIDIDFTEVENEIIVSFTDNGIGIAEENFKRVFDLFVRLNDKEEFPGSGVGLSIAKKMMERMGGQISLKSLPGKGTTVYLNFPQRLTLNK